MTHEEIRKARIQQIYESIKSCSEKELACDKEKLIAICGAETGIARRTILEFINMLLGSGKIIEKENSLNYQKSHKTN
jgi:hypothetical protein